MPSTTHIAVDVSRATCDGPLRASLPYIDSVAASIRISAMSGMALIHTGGFLLSCVMSLCLCAVFLRMLFVPVSDEAAGEFLPNYLELETVVASHEIEDMKENTTDDLVVENEEDLASIDGIESNHYQEPKVFVSDSVNADIYR